MLLDKLLLYVFFELKPILVSLPCILNASYLECLNFKWLDPMINQLITYIIFAK